jgi:predicted Zn-dependent protease
VAVDHGRTPAESRILSDLWLQSAATFRRWGKLDQCVVAIEEAEVLDPENAEVWIQLGLYHTSLSPPNHVAATPAFTKSILLRPDHPAGVVCLAKLYLETDQVELAHSFLNQVTQDGGWDVAEAWYYLAKVCERQGREERAGECLRFALGMEEGRPCRRWREGVDRWL